jgi:transposase
MDVKKAGAKNKTASADKALSMIQRLYALERPARDQDMDDVAIYEMRPAPGKADTWSIQAVVGEKKRSGAAEKPIAIHYCLGQWHRLENYINVGHAGIDNNVIENAIRPFALGRKNRLFSGNPGRSSGQRPAVQSHRDGQSQ